MPYTITVLSNGAFECNASNRTPLLHLDSLLSGRYRHFIPLQQSQHQNQQVCSQKTLAQPSFASVVHFSTTSIGEAKYLFSTNILW